MTGYEELAMRAVLALEAANQPNWVEIGGLVVGLVQCGLIYVGLKRMGESSAERKAQHEAAMQTMKDQHVENMTVLKDQHVENMTVVKDQHEQAMKNHEQVMTAMQEQGEQATRNHEATMLALRGLLGAREAGMH